MHFILNGITMFYAQLEIFSTLNTDKVAVKRLGVRAGPDNCKSESGFIASLLQESNHLKLTLVGITAVHCYHATGDQSSCAM